MTSPTRLAALGTLALLLAALHMISGSPVSADEETVTTKTTVTTTAAPAADGDAPLKTHSVSYQFGAGKVLGPDVKLNNEGVRLMNAGKLVEAIAMFKESLQVQPTATAASNLSVAFNNLGMQQSEAGSHKDALKSFHQSAYVCPDNATTRGNIDKTITALGRNPEQFEDRLALADEANAAGDLAGVIVEYTAALKIREDAALRSKLDKAKRPADLPAAGSGKGDPTVPYLQAVQKKVQEAFQPPYGNKASVEIAMTILKGGQLHEVVVTQSSGDTAYDDYALAIARKAAPFPAFTTGMRPDTLKFTFALSPSK